jgi:hypothetical protein
MGQAAGTAAAMAIKRNLSPADLPYRDLKQHLLAQQVALS